MKPRLVSREAFTVVGFKCRASKQNNVVPRLWDDFNKVCAGIPHSVKDRTAYGVCYLGGRRSLRRQVFLSGRGRGFNRQRHSPGHGTACGSGK
ncbi:MAG TPA: hypothetical protein PLB85_00255 [Candidatus Syntrophosphaera sp.]|nr:hypothetical protein [Candidatus Syntrophosphaera sp.]